MEKSFESSTKFVTFARERRYTTVAENGHLQYSIMKLKKRKIIASAIFFLCWAGLLIFIVDGVVKFQTLVDYVGSYAVVEIALWLIVLLPALMVYKFTKE